MHSQLALSSQFLMCPHFKDLLNRQHIQVFREIDSGYFIPIIFLFCSFHFVEEHFLPSGELDQSLNDYLQQHIPKWTKRVSGASDAPGSPLLLLVSSAATRVVQVNK